MIYNFNFFYFLIFFVIFVLSMNVPEYIFISEENKYMDFVVCYPEYNNFCRDNIAPLMNVEFTQSKINKNEGVLDVNIYFEVDNFYKISFYKISYHISNKKDIDFNYFSFILDLTDIDIRILFDKVENEYELKEKIVKKSKKILQTVYDDYLNYHDRKQIIFDVKDSEKIFFSNDDLLLITPVLKKEL